LNYIKSIEIVIRKYKLLFKKLQSTKYKTDEMHFKY